jgi:hypothetical protein
LFGPLALLVGVPPDFAFVLVALGLDLAPAVVFWRRWSTTTGDFGGGGAGIEVVASGCGVAGAGAGGGGDDVEVLVVGWLPAGGGVSASGAGVVVVGVVSGVLVVSLAVPSAEPANGPASAAAVMPPPATAESTARTARLRALLSGGMLCGRSSRGRPMVVGRRGWPTSLGTPTAIHIGRTPGIRKGFVIGLTNL